MQIKTTTDLTSRTYADVLALRKAVFVNEQHVPLEREIKGEAGKLYFAGYIEGKIAGCARVFEEQTGCWHVERVVTKSVFRGHGLGRQLFAAIEAAAATHQITKLRLGAQDQAQGFYERLGFKVIGAGFMDAGIPHHMMEKTLI